MAMKKVGLMLYEEIEYLIYLGEEQAIYSNAEAGGQQEQA